MDLAYGRVYVATVAQALEDVRENVVVGGLHSPPEEVLDHLIALVHGLLDEREARQRADHIQTRHGGFVAGGQFRGGIRCIGEKPRSGVLYELPGGNGAESGD